MGGRQEYMMKNNHSVVHVIRVQFTATVWSNTAGWDEIDYLVHE